MSSPKPTPKRHQLTLCDEAGILLLLANGPVLSFGSDMGVNRVVQRLRKQGKIEYRKVKDGGQGWELVK